MLQSVSYLVDIWRGTVPVTRKLLDYATYKAIFSQLIAGPIVRYAEIKDELVSPHRTASRSSGSGRGASWSASP